MHVDEFIDELLHAERMCDIILPRLQASQTHVLSFVSQTQCWCVCKAVFASLIIRFAFVENTT